MLIYISSKISNYTYLCKRAGFLAISRQTIESDHDVALERNSLRSPQKIPSYFDLQFLDKAR